MEEDEIYFGQPGAFDHYLDGKFQDIFGGPTPLGAGRPAWFGYSSPGEEQVHQALSLVQRGALPSVKRAEYDMYWGGSAAILVWKTAPPRAVAIHLHPPAALTDEQLCDELQRVAERALRKR